MEYAQDLRRREAVRPSRAGFTLMELLTVTVIIGLLATMISAAAFFARITAREGALNKEIYELSAAVEAYRVQMGEYPPDGSDPAAVKRHMLKAFRYMGQAPEVKPSTALVFWLGGVIDQNGIPIGFSDSRNPFDPANKNRIGPFYDFDPQRISGGAYYFTGLSTTEGTSMYVYFRAEKGSGYAGKESIVCGTKPYMDATAKELTPVNPDTFQIHSPGLDGIHGAAIQYPIGTDYLEPDYDDQTNFSNGPLSKKMP